jgi:hypothetical protein
MACGKIAEGVIIDCTVRLIAGTMETVILVNYDDYKLATVTPGSDPLSVTSVDFTPLLTGTYGFEFTGKKNSNDPLVESNRGTYDLYYKHSLGMKIFSNDVATKRTLDDMGDSLVVAFVENKNSGTAGDSSFEIYGSQAGLEISQLNRNPNDADTKGAWDLILANSDDDLEGTVPLQFFDTDYATTKANFLGLLDAIA